jgi:hypothetical protein
MTTPVVSALKNYYSMLLGREHNWRYTRIWIKLMRGGKGQGRKAKLTATEDEQSRINGLVQRAHCL